MRSRAMAFTSETALNRFNFFFLMADREMRAARSVPRRLNFAATHDLWNN
jgi:hypothetical protein